MSETQQDWKLLGLTLDRKINLLALSAFVMSLFSIGIHAWQYLEGAKINLSVGERVNILFRAHPAQPDTPFLVINARLNYTNTGAIGRDAIIGSEWVEIIFSDDLSYEYRWLHFEVYLPETDGSPKAQVEDTAHDFVVPGASAESHQTTFVGFKRSTPRNSSARTNPLAKLAFDGLMKSHPKITLRFIAEDIYGKLYTASCQLAVTQEVINAIDKTDWATALCGESVNSDIGG